MYNSQRLLTPGLQSIVFFFLVVGCVGTEPVNPAPEEGPKAALSVPTIDGTQLQERLAALRGKVILIDFWATWCPACVEALPHTLELGRMFADRGLSVITVSLDSAERLDLVREVLGAQGALDSGFVAAHGVSEQTFEEFGIDGGAIPYFLLYDRAGRRHGGYQSFEEVESALRELLSETEHQEAPRPSE